jgi:hypothetical protein
MEYKQDHLFRSEKFEDMYIPKLLTIRNVVQVKNNKMKENINDIHCAFTEATFAFEYQFR